MLKRLLLSLLLLAVLAGGWRPAMAGLHGDGGTHGVVAAAMQHHPAAQADTGCAAASGHHQQAQETPDTADRNAPMGCCTAMAAGCAAPVLGVATLDLGRVGEALHARPWPRPAERPTALAPTPDLRPPKPSL